MEKKIDKKILDRLNSEKESIVISTVSQLQFTGTPEILPHLCRLFFVSSSEGIKAEILNLLNNLKDENSVSYLVEALKKYKGQELYNDFVSACWQNGLDFSDDLQIFIDLVIEQELLTAVEAFSVVEGNISELPDAEREKHAVYIRSKLKSLAAERKSLVKELLHVVENVSGPLQINLN